MAYGEIGTAGSSSRLGAVPDAVPYTDDDEAHTTRRTPLVARREQHVERPDHVRRVARQRIVDRALDGRQGGLVEDDLAAGDCLLDPLVALDVPLDQLDLAAEPAHVLPAPGGEVVEDAHPVAPLGAGARPGASR